MERFVHSQNLLRYAKLLQEEMDAARLERLHHLLIEEVNRFGSWRERVQEADELICKGVVRLRQQEGVVAQLSGDGRDTVSAERLLLNIYRTLEAFRRYRQTLDGDRPVDVR